MYTRGVRVGSTFLGGGRVEDGRRGRRDVMSLGFIRGDHLGSLDGQILGMLIDFLYRISFVVGLHGVRSVTPLVVLERWWGTGRGRVELEAVDREACGV